MLKLRAMQMVLIMFYAEELKRKVLDLIQTTDAHERTFRSEIGRLKRKIGELHAVRGEDIRALNAEMSLTKTEFDNDELHPAHPLHKYDDGRLWARMQVAVYRHHFADQAAIAWSGRQTCG